MEACPYCSEIAVSAHDHYFDDVCITRWSCKFCGKKVAEDRQEPKVGQAALLKVLPYLDMETTSELRRQVGLTRDF